ncbi:uncharacterized protein LOC123706337 [Colias croceus]|nr:uncharacterized protein LOC123699640 [Colias croceus]XP_045511503.1 uncharacterized protein LOC123706337 [Colias croceus]
MYLNINEIYAKLGDQLSCSFAICHIFTGNDYNPAFFRKGKKRPFSIFKKNKNFQEAFIQLLRSDHTVLTTSNEIVRIIEEYVCRVYSLKTKNDINRGRYELFEKGYRSKGGSEKVLKKNIIGYDPSSLPPTKQELLQQIKRTVFISNVWCNAHMRCPTDKVPENYGWTIIDGKYEYYWFDGPQSPSFEELSSQLQDLDTTEDQNEEDTDEDEESDASSEDECFSDESDEN